MDFKPEAGKENEGKVVSQLYLYASGLSFRTKIPLGNFRCAWFDDSVYYEFGPKEAKVRFPNSKWRSNKQRILEGKAMDFVSRAGNEFWKDFGLDWKGLTQKEATDFGNHKSGDQNE